MKKRTRKPPDAQLVKMAAKSIAILESKNKQLIDDQKRLIAQLKIDAAIMCQSRRPEIKEIAKGTRQLIDAISAKTAVSPNVAVANCALFGIASEEGEWW